MYSAPFIFATKHFDAEFHRLDQQIAAMAKQMPGYLGEETCENHEAGLTSNVYYWESQEAIQELMQHPGRAPEGRIGAGELACGLSGGHLAGCADVRWKLNDRLPVTTAA